MAAWGSRMVPPPMVPTSMEGMETEIWRFPLRLRKSVSIASVVINRRMSAYFLMTVMQLLLSTFWAGSWPVARKIAVTMFAA